MSDGEESSDQEYYVDPSREDDIRSDILSHLDILKDKTINFEDLLNELVRLGCLSFEEKFKILSGIVDETKVHESIPEKCTSLYQTLLIRKRTSLSALLQAWETTGNSYLVGRFDTHFALEGRDSKSLKFHKLKALPSHRTEFLSHLHLKQLTLSPRALLKCLRKSSRLVSIRLERIKVPYGGRSSDDPSSDFDQPLMLPNLKDFYFEEVSKAEPFKSVKEVNFFLDELNLKPMLFFGLNSNMAWEAGIRIEVRMRGGVLLKIDPGQGQDEGQGGSSFTSMLRRRPVEYGGFINPENVEKVSLYECYLPKAPFSSRLTHLIIYRCKVPNFEHLLSSCPHLQGVTLVGEAEANNISQIDLNCLSASKSSLTSLTLGYTSIFFSNYWDKDLELGLRLETLLLDTCSLKLDKGDYAKIFSSLEKLLLISVAGGGLADWIQGVAKIGEISVQDFSWEGKKSVVDLEKVVEDEENLEKVPEVPDNSGEILDFLSGKVGGLKKGKDTCFCLERIGPWRDEVEVEEKVLEELEESGEKVEEKVRLEDVWKVKKMGKGSDKMTWEVGRLGEFVGEVGRKSWFDLPFKLGDGESGESSGDPRTVFRETHGF